MENNRDFSFNEIEINPNQDGELIVTFKLNGIDMYSLSNRLFPGERLTISGVSGKLEFNLVDR